MKQTVYFGILFIAVAVAIANVAAQTRTSRMSSAKSSATVDRALHIPDVNYRKNWTLLGSFSILADNPEDGAKELHVVYADPGSVTAYRKTGVFPDGAVLVKDVFAVKTEALTTGTASYANSLIGRFIMVKDGDNKRAGKSPLWGNGWGWAYYEGSETRKTVTTDYQADCLGCHEPARSQDFLFVQGYPVLRR